MFKFNSDNIFTGYLKQLLHDFNLPKYKVYTKEQEEYHKKRLQFQAQYETELARLLANQQRWKEEVDAIKEQENWTPQNIADYNEKRMLYELATIDITNLQEKHNYYTNPELNIMETVYRIQEIVYPDSLAEEEANKTIFPLRMRYVPYIKDGRIQEYVEGTWHDCHETLEVAHKRIHKDNLKNKVQYYTYGQKILNYTKNLQIQNNIYDSYTHEYLGDYLRFHRDFANINLMPLYNCFSNKACPRLKLNFKIDDYNVNFDTNQEFNSTLYKYYMIPVKFFKNYTIAIESKSAIEMCCCVYGASQNTAEQFSSVPVLTYQRLSASQFSKPILYTKINNLSTLLETNNNSELIQYEDDLKLILKIPATNKSSIVILEGDYINYKESNKTIVNLETDEAANYLLDKLTTPLQLLRFNTGESYPFADRLIEYLVGNAVAPNEEIEDNVKRIKKVVSTRCADMKVDATNGIWEPTIQVLVYNYINANSDTYTVNHDILGYVDKDVEKVYSYGVNANSTTISNVDIYD